MAFTPEAGIPLLELHLERIRDSAGELGFAFDRHAVRNAVQALCFDADRPAALRLVVAASGAYALELGAMPPPLPDPVPCALLRLPAARDGRLLRFSHGDMALRDTALRSVAEAGAAEGILVDAGDAPIRGSFTDIFVERGGRLLTPPAGRGVLRRSLLDAGRAVAAPLTPDDLVHGFFIGNALRGLMPAVLLR